MWVVINAMTNVRIGGIFDEYNDALEYLDRLRARNKQLKLGHAPMEIVQWVKGRMSQNGK